MAQTPVEVKKAAPVPAPAPVDAWHSFRHEMDRMFDRFAAGFHLPSLGRLFDTQPMRSIESSFSFSSPAIDVTEDDKAYKITAELPGLEEKNVDISVSGDMLTLKGEKEQHKEEKDKNYYMSERAFGSFQRAFALPQGIDRDNIAADLSKGVLTITLPKTAEAQKPEKKIAVKAA